MPKRTVVVFKLVPHPFVLQILLTIAEKASLICSLFNLRHTQPGL